jgi:hypothetical protein
VVGGSSHSGLHIADRDFIKTRSYVHLLKVDKRIVYNDFGVSADIQPSLPRIYGGFATGVSTPGTLSIRTLREMARVKLPGSYAY